MNISLSSLVPSTYWQQNFYFLVVRGGSKARRPRALARVSGQIFCNFLCKSLWISYINPYKLDNFFRFFDYLLAISYINPYKCVANFFYPDFIIILALSLIAVINLQWTRKWIQLKLIWWSWMSQSMPSKRKERKIYFMWRIFTRLFCTVDPTIQMCVYTLEDCKILHLIHTAQTPKTQ